MALNRLLRRLGPTRPPDRVSDGTLQAISSPPAADRAPRPGGQRRQLEETLARKILEGHLQNRRQLMQSEPADLRGVSQETARLLIRAMAAAAHADGGYDSQERARIKRALSSTDLPAAEQAALAAALNEPPCLEDLLRQVESPETATRFYAVSLAAAERGRGANRFYLDYLAHRLRLPGDVVVRLNRAYDVPV